jgi:hypothetical protein
MTADYHPASEEDLQHILVLLHPVKHIDSHLEGWFIYLVFSKQILRLKSFFATDLYQKLSKIDTVAQNLVLKKKVHIRHSVILD